MQQLPNLLSILRLLFVPWFALVLLEGQFDTALALFLLMGLSDGLDGYLARRLQAQSALGKALDPLADKVMLVTGFVLLGHLGLLPAWLVVLAVGRDMLVTGGVLLLYLFRPEIALQAAWAGKLNTFMQIALLLCVMLGQIAAFPPLLFELLHVLVAALAVFSGAWYLMQWGRALSARSA